MLILPEVQAPFDERYTDCFTGHGQELLELRLKAAEKSFGHLVTSRADEHALEQLGLVHGHHLLAVEARKRRPWVSY